MYTPAEFSVLHLCYSTYTSMYCVPYRYCVSFSFVKAICGHWSAYLKTYIYSIYVHCTAGAGQNDVIDHLLSQKPAPIVCTTFPVHNTLVYCIIYFFLYD